MKKLISITSLIAIFFLLSNCQPETSESQPVDKIEEKPIVRAEEIKSTEPQTEQAVFVPLTKERFTEIEKLNEEQDWCPPILIKGVERNELIAFYIKSYSDETISSWVDWAFKKMNSFKESIPSAEQVIEFEKIMKLPRNRENTFLFMSEMTDVQFETVGY